MTLIPTRAPLGKMLVVFIGMLMAGNVLVAGVEYLLPDLTMPSSMGIVFLMVGAMQAGQTAARSTGRRLTTGEKASFAIASTALSLALGVGLVWGVLAWFGVPFTAENVVLAMTGGAVPYAEIMEFLPWVGLFVVVVSLVLSYFAVGWGARTLLKQQERLAAKGK